MSPGNPRKLRKFSLSPSEVNSGIGNPYMGTQKSHRF